MLAPAIEHVDGARVEVDGPARGARLAARLVQFVADGHERPGDGELRAVEVDVAPLETEDLTASHPGVGGDPQRRVAAVISC